MFVSQKNATKLHGMTGTRLVALIALQTGEQTGRDVCNTISGVADGTVYNALDRLVEDGYVEKEEPLGSRSNLYRSTDRGREVAETIQQYLNNAL